MPVDYKEIREDILIFCIELFDTGQKARSLIGMQNVDAVV